MLNLGRQDRHPQLKSYPSRTFALYDNGHDKRAIRAKITTRSGEHGLDAKDSELVEKDEV